jgi:myo-inositol-1(or 4)-monophosphatase
MNHLLDSIIDICHMVGVFQLKNFRSVSADSITDKGLNQLVSFVDVESEKMLVAKLAELRPDAGFITEENTAPAAQQNQTVWIIDPLDGTTNYLHGLQIFSISIALMEHGQLAAGVVYIPALGETFSAAKGCGAFLNNKPIKVSKTKNLSESLIATGFPYHEFQQTEAYLRLLGELMRGTHGLRRMGSAAIDLAYTACGRFDGFYETGLSAWDVAAGALIVQEAGGVVTDFKKTDQYIFGKQIVAGNPSIMEALQEATQKYLG